MAGESRGHSPLTPTKSRPIRKPSLPNELLFLASGFWLNGARELIQNTEGEALTSKPTLPLRGKAYRPLS